MRTASSAPIARAFLNVGSASFNPTATTVIFSIVPPVVSFNSIALVNASSSHGLIIHCIPAVSNAVLSAVNLILVVVSGTLLIQISIFIIN